MSHGFVFTVIFRSPPPDADWKNWIVAVPFSPTPRTIVCLDKIPGDDEISPQVKTTSKQLEGPIREMKKRKSRSKSKMVGCLF